MICRKGFLEIEVDTITLPTMENLIDDSTVDELEDLYFDMDVSTSGIHDTTKNSQILSTPSESPEFEFNMSSMPVEYESADQLFFKGQLLPLLLPSRMQMVQTLCSSAKSESQLLRGQDEKINLGSRNSVVSDFRANKLRCSSCSPPVEMHNSSSGRQSSSSFWHSCDKDSAESSCRDSDGSSQDSSFSSKDMMTRERHAKGLQDVLISSANGKTAKDQSSWLKIAFQWKLFFGYKKACKVKIREKNKQKPTSDANDAKPHNHMWNASPGAYYISPFCADRSCKYAKARQNYGLRHQAIPLSSYSRRIYKALTSDKSCTNEGAQKPGDSWQNCLKPLKHMRDKVLERNNNRGEINEQAWMEESIAGQSFFVRESHYTKKPSCSSFLPASLRVPSFSRRSSTATSRLNSSTSSPNHSGVLSPLDYHATMADIHSAIQGAIAHCKQSQASKQDFSGEIH